MTDDTLRDEVAGVLAGHTPMWDHTVESGFTTECGCAEFRLFGVTRQEAEVRYGTHLADALLPLLARKVEEARGEALREAAREAEERGDIGKSGGVEAWDWLRGIVNRAALGESTGREA